MQPTKMYKVDSTLEDLPEHLIHNIMNFLPYKEASKFIFLSKSLNSYWLSFPTLNFNYKSISSEDVSYDPFFTFVQKTLQLRGPHIKGYLQNLTLSYTEMHESNNSHNHYREVFDLLLNFAVENNVKVINFDINNIGQHSKDMIVNVKYHSLHPLFSSQFLTVLKLIRVKIALVDAFITCPKLTELVLKSCDGFQTINVPSSSSLKIVEVKCCNGLKAFHILDGKSLHSFKFEAFKEKDDDLHQCDLNLPTPDFLRYMHLTNVELSENIYNKVVPRVEILHIHECHMPKNMRLHSPHIKVLEMRRNYNIENLVLSTPNLDQFIYEDSETTQQPCTLDISQYCVALRVLKLVRATTITAEWLKSTLGRLHCLKELGIRYCNMLERVEFENASLQKLSLRDCSHLKEVIVDVSNLLEFCYRGNLLVNPMFISSAKCNGIISMPPRMSNLDLIKKFLGFFDHFKSLTICCFWAEDMIFPKQEKRINNISPLYDLRHVELRTRNSPLNGRPLTQLLESLLWFAPKPETLTLSCQLRNTRSTLKFTYGKRVEWKNLKKVGACCYDIPIKCWRHYEVKIEFQGFDEPVREYLEEFFADSLRDHGIYKHG